MPSLFLTNKKPKLCVALNPTLICRSLLLAIMKTFTIVLLLRKNENPTQCVIPPKMWIHPTQMGRDQDGQRPSTELLQIV
jgi:hypothetical protein